MPKAAPRKPEPARRGAKVVGPDRGRKGPSYSAVDKGRDNKDKGRDKKKVKLVI